MPPPGWLPTPTRSTNRADAPARAHSRRFARAFQVSESTVTAVAFEAMRYDLQAVRSETDLSTGTDEQLARATAVRLRVDLDREDGEGHGQQSAFIDEGDDPGGVVAQLHDMEAEARRRVADRYADLSADLAARRHGGNHGSSRPGRRKTGMRNRGRIEEGAGG